MACYTRAPHGRQRFMCAGNKLISCCTRWKPQIATKKDHSPVATFGYIVYNSCLYSALYTKKKKTFTYRGEKHIVWQRSRSESYSEFSGNDLVLWVCQPPPTSPWQMSTLQHIYLSFGDQARSFSMALLKPQLIAHITVFFQLQENAALNREHQLEEWCCRDFVVCFFFFK